MKKFNKAIALKNLNHKNNSNIKSISLVISVFFLVGAIIYFSFARFEKIESFNLISGVVYMEPTPIIEKITNLASSGATDLEYDGTDTLGANGTVDNNLRYVGATPNNYVYFNCSTNVPSEMDDTTCEKWRIIGIMNNVEDENGNSASRVKIMRDESLGHYSWDTTTNSINNNNGINQWGESGTYEGADLMRELNTDYLGNITVGTDNKWYNGANNSKTGAMPSKTLSNYSQSMVQTVKWNTSSNGSNSGSTWLTKNFYAWERGTYTGKTCTSGDYCNDDVTRTTDWIGKVGLMYPSDYFYSTSGGATTNKTTCLNTSVTTWNGDGVTDCKNNSWVFDSNNWQWTLFVRNTSSYANSVFNIVVNGALSYGGAHPAGGVRPTLYLTSDIAIASGNGSSSNPYKLIQPSILIDRVTTLVANKSKDLEYDGVDTLGENGTEDNNLRYIGANPDNYIYFNCSTTNPDEMNDETCEKWRIIGLMNNIEDENGNTASRVKIIRNKSLGYYSWDSSDSSINDGYGINQWGPSTYEDGTPYEGADLMRELNTDYLGNITVGTNGKWYDEENNAKNESMPSSSLNVNTQSMIETVKWNTGADVDEDSSTWTTINMYTWERSNNSSKICSSDHSECDDVVVRTLDWVGKVALMYPSDYGYSTSGGTNQNKETCLNVTLEDWYQTDDCNIKSWLYQDDGDSWTMMPKAVNNSSTHVFVYSVDWLDNKYASNYCSVRPTLFLKSNVSVVSGDGTSSNPYKLMLN